MNINDEFGEITEFNDFENRTEKKIRSVTAIGLVSEESLSEYSAKLSGEVVAYKLSEEELAEVRRKYTPVIKGPKATPAQIEIANKLMKCVYGKPLEKREYSRDEIRSLTVSLLIKKREIKPNTKD